ncbi:MAG: Dyp-type peroxidase, partial [Vulcanimicrobiaceae bacterium]
DFEGPIRGADGYTMPATQADIWVWFSAASYDIVFDMGTAATAALAPYATLEREQRGWSYRHNRDLTGFEDGTENPKLDVVPEIVAIEHGKPGSGGSVLLFQVWQHRARAFDALPVEKQEAVIGRTKPDSIEFDDARMPTDSHVSRTKVRSGGEELKIFRRNVPYGIVSDHGTLFIGFSAEQSRMHRMLEQMAGLDGPRDALTFYTSALTGAYYFVPSVQSLRAFAPPEEDE